eukprot:7085806-Prymnesium_polylepis.1
MNAGASTRSTRSYRSTASGPPSIDAVTESWLAAWLFDQVLDNRLACVALAMMRRVAERAHARPAVP